jgi:hypothetical protein
MTRKQVRRPTEVQIWLEVVRPAASRHSLETASRPGNDHQTRFRTPRPASAPDATSITTSIGVIVESGGDRGQALALASQPMILDPRRP